MSNDSSRGEIVWDFEDPDSCLHALEEPDFLEKLEPEDANEAQKESFSAEGSNPAEATVDFSVFMGGSEHLHAMVDSMFQNKVWGIVSVSGSEQDNGSTRNDDSGEVDMIVAVPTLKNPEVYPATIVDVMNYLVQHGTSFERLEQGIRDGLVPDPNTPLETKVHSERKRKSRPTGLKYKKKAATGKANRAKAKVPKGKSLSQ